MAKSMKWELSTGSILQAITLKIPKLNVFFCFAYTSSRTPEYLLPACLLPGSP